MSWGGGNSRGAAFLVLSSWFLVGRYVAVSRGVAVEVYVEVSRGAAFLVLGYLLAMEW